MLNKPRAWQACTSRHNFAVSGLFDLKNLEPPKNKKFLFLTKHNNSEWVYSMFSKCFPSDFVYDTGLNPFNSPDEFRLQSIYVNLKPFDELCLLYVIIHTGALFHSTIHRWIQFTHLWTAEYTRPQNPLIEYDSRILWNHFTSITEHVQGYGSQPYLCVCRREFNPFLLINN
jgi:hypothetical protein